LIFGELSTAFTATFGHAVLSTHGAPTVGSPFKYFEDGQLVHLFGSDGAVQYPGKHEISQGY